MSSEHVSSWRMVARQDRPEMGVRSRFARAAKSARVATELSPLAEFSRNAYFDAPGGIWVAIDAPSFTGDVRVDAGVLSVRGWAWSKAHGAGVVKLLISHDGSSTEHVCAHRYHRHDVCTSIPAVPVGNYAGFEISIDRSELPGKCSLSVLYTWGLKTIQSPEVGVHASHAGTNYGPLVDIVCDCCGGSQLSLLGKKDGLAIKRCDNCGLAFTSPRPTFDVIKQRYSQQYFSQEYLPDIGAGAELGPHKARWNYYLDQIDRFRAVSPRLFEVGIGAGYFLQEAKGRGWQCAGIDLNMAAVEYARGNGIAAECGDIATQDFGERRFGAMVLESVLEHVMSPRAVLEKCAAALLPGGGMFILTLGCEGDIFITQGMAMQYVGPSEHLYYFSNSSLCRMCEEAGLRVEHLWLDDTRDTVLLVASRRYDTTMGR